MKYPPDEASSHKYEVKKVHMDSATFDAVVFYLRAGEPVSINVEDVLKKTSLWMEPTKFRCAGEAPEDDKGPVELYISRFNVELKERIS